ncbi:hypothetical protein [Spirosoma radiotolerans]|uniref:Uncharacterized protein n=1 Tax=Spirosoma radiotolerans TaxID=1379870 RepID=A0A0E3V6I5_9BACT|nr:hypothetical protein [Spirosoma radiotolerans]AKD55052.1 hypothetical protein SD10_09175 [Spirosoma radiotolerans]
MTKPHHSVPLADKENLKAFLSSFYSIGQLHIIYCTLTDKSPYPDMTEHERSIRTEAVRELLGIKPPIEIEAKPDKSKKRK